MKTLLLIASFIFTSVMFGQHSINNYKYVVVPYKYDFQSVENKHQINTLTKFLFEKYGFEVYFDVEDQPLDLRLDVCKALSANLNESSSMFKTEIVIELFDCNNNLVFQSLKGISKDKNIKKAYHEAIREASASLEVLNYKYVENTATQPQLKTTQNNKLEEKSITPQNKVEVKEQEHKIEEKPILKFKNNDVIYELISNNGFQILQEAQSKKNIARLIQSFQGTIYHYQEPTQNGFGVFDTYGNLNVEIINSKGNKEIKIFKLLN